MKQIKMLAQTAMAKFDAKKMIVLVLTCITGFNLSTILISKFKITAFSQDWYFMMGLFGLVFVYGITMGMGIRYQKKDEK